MHSVHHGQIQFVRQLSEVVPIVQANADAMRSYADTYIHGNDYGAYSQIVDIIDLYDEYSNALPDLIAMAEAGREMYDGIRSYHYTDELAQVRDKHRHLFESEGSNEVQEDETE